MDERSSKALEQALLQRPFDHEVRTRYADRLLAEGDFAAALTQWQLLLSAGHDEAAAHTGVARCNLGMGDPEAARVAYDTARGLPGFEPVPELERAMAPAPSAPTLQVIEGSRDNVVDMAGFRGDRQRIGFADVAGMEALKKTLRLQIIEPFVRPGLFQRFKKKAGGGVLLYGPPGCGKTMMARAIASECGAAFVTVGISDILDRWIGESERNLALLFDKARAERPCVMFFDELDALAFSRSKAISEHSRTVVNEFLSQLDGFDHDNEGVLVLAATNMPWDVDAAMKRPGRFSRLVFVPPPDETARRVMFETKLAGVPSEGVDVVHLARVTRHYSGADIDGLIDQAKDNALADIIEAGGTERPLQQRDLLDAVELCSPSTLDWLRTARNLVRYAGADASYKDVEKYLKQEKL